LFQKRAFLRSNNDIGKASGQNHKNPTHVGSKGLAFPSSENAAAQLDESKSFSSVFERLAHHPMRRSQVFCVRICAYDHFQAAIIRGKSALF